MDGFHLENKELEETGVIIIEGNYLLFDEKGCLPTFLSKFIPMGQKGWF